MLDRSTPRDQAALRSRPLRLAHHFQVDDRPEFCQLRMSEGGYFLGQGGGLDHGSIYSFPVAFSANDFSTMALM